MILGFTGTRKQPTMKQARRFRIFLSDNDSDIDEFHHGGCDGSDLMAHRLALWYFMPVVVHPPIKETFLAFECLEPHPNVTVLERKPYLARDRDIVNVPIDCLFATPDGPRRPHSGTWYTIDYAIYRHVPVVICWPDGQIKKVA